MKLMLRETLLLRAFGLFKIPMIFFVRPSVVELNDRRVVVKVPLRYRTKNHLGSMYFGVLCTGADCAGGLMAMRLLEPYGKRGSLVFKDFQAVFLKRPTQDVQFLCEDGDLVAELVRKAAASGKREEAPVRVVASIASEPEPVARFTLTLSLKIRP